MNLKFSDDRIEVTCKKCSAKYHVLASTAARSSFKGVCYSCARRGLSKSTRKRWRICIDCGEAKQVSVYNTRHNPRCRSCADKEKARVRVEAKALSAQRDGLPGKPKKQSDTRPCLKCDKPVVKPRWVCDRCLEENQRIGGMEENTTGRYVSRPFFPVG